MDNNQEIAALEKWGFPLVELYRLALSFYKQNSGKAIHLSYEDNLKLIAFKQQATMGPFDASHAPELGVLDVIGRDRHMHWQLLGDISREQAMEGFIDLLDNMCTAFRPYTEAVKQNRDENLKAELRRMEEEKLEKEKREREQKELLEEGYREEMQRRQLQDALNRQTFQQFKSYAEKQFPGNPEQQGVLIRQLQEEHYHQYMQQLHMHKKNNNSESVDGGTQHLLSKDTTAATGNANELFNALDHHSSDEQQQDDLSQDDYLIIEPARMWTRPDIKAFKAEVSAGEGDGVITVGHGDVVTVRVPTISVGKCIFFEFATDNYDIAFGLFFEWSKPTTNEVIVQGTESENDEDEELIDDELVSMNDDLEAGSVSNEREVLAQNSVIKPPVSIIVPMYRRDCQNEVYVGSHKYPGEGVYLLRFDNTFSMWRSKTVYYRIYYEH
ncbi:PREDICTED: Golgi resident protein GCP60 [Rhagoletis zephyria]|uniref:Golgi resident protein GCP60 n=1 Tax=Rhagoletis zephyria TaxID=28612 RepID=UPI0008117756|nr:PREDICTED: Golgi resident protein GCP60 [Rhagoletis zephyria]XP_036339025.1 Golgi resident protein GCP60 [Rhagoletis pomonella]